MQLLRKKPLYLFLLVLFFCLHGTVENFGYIGAQEVLWTGITILVYITILFLVILWLTKDHVLAALTGFFISCWYLFFGAIHDWIRKVTAASFVSYYSVLLPLLVIGTVLFFIILKRKKKTAVKLCFYLNVLLLIYCLIDGGLLVKKQLAPKHTITKTVVFDNSKVTTRPNVYFLLFDEYPGRKSLRDSFAFDNGRFYEFLEQKEFTVLPLYANYDFTPFSMSSILNMRYIEAGYNWQAVSQRDIQIRISEIRNGEVFDIFKGMGYDIQNYSVFDIGETAGLANKNSFFPVHSMLLTDKILHNRIIRTSGWLFQKGILAMPSWKKKFMYQHETNNRYATDLLLNNFEKENGRPKFCYSHFMLPHWPFYRDSAGVPNSVNIVANRKFVSDKSLFLSYVKYTNSIIETLIENITERDPAAVVIIMSDHGFRNYRNTVVFEPLNFDNLCAVHFPGKSNPEFKKEMSAVNFFRYLFNSGFGQHIPYLKDSVIVLNY